MVGKFSLDGGMIPRATKRVVDERLEERFEAGCQTAILGHRGRNHVVRVLNLSRSGAMVIFPAVPHIGEDVTLQLLDRAPVRGAVRWVRDGRIGVNFDAPLE